MPVGIGDCSGEEKITGWQYKLRAAAPMPVEGYGVFKYHTFMAEKYQIDTYLYTNDLPSSTEFRGQGGSYLSASFNRLEDNSGEVFSGKVVYAPTFVEEEDLDVEQGI